MAITEKPIWAGLKIIFNQLLLKHKDINMLNSIFLFILGLL